MAKKNKRQNKPRGHYCYVCGEHKANEKFSGRGHTNHICKKCQALPVAQRNELIAERKTDRFSFRDYDRQLDRLAKIKTTVLFSELDDTQKTEVTERLDELLGDYFEFAEHLLEAEDKNQILLALCGEMSDILAVKDFFVDFDEDDKPEKELEKELIADDALEVMYAWEHCCTMWRSGCRSRPLFPRVRRW